MTRSEAIKAFFFKSVLPVTMALILYCIFKSACMKNGELDYVWLWILCGLPFGLHRMCLWIVPGGGSLGGGIALFALNFIIGGVIGGFILAWRLIVAVWYVPLALDTLRAAVWPPSDVPLDRAGRRLPGWRDRPVCVELYYRWCDWWFRSSLAAYCGDVVYAADSVPADR